MRFMGVLALVCGFLVPYLAQPDVPAWQQAIVQLVMYLAAVGYFAMGWRG